MKFSKEITIYLEKFKPTKIGVSDMPSFDACDKVLLAELKAMDIEISDNIRQELKLKGDKL